MSLRSIVGIRYNFRNLLASHPSCKSLHSYLQLCLLSYFKYIANKWFLWIKEVNAILKALIHNFPQLPYEFLQLLVGGRVCQAC